MTIIYDFDGTLTPYSMPQYEILKKCGYDDEKQRDRRNLVINQCGISMYQAYYEVYEDVYTEIEELVSDGMKPEIIKKILRDSNSKNVIYIGDGMTDRYAFEYVHTIGGTSLYVGSTDKDLDNFSKLKEEGIVDNYFERDYSKDSELRTYIMKKAGILK